MKLRPAPEMAAGSPALSYIFAVATAASIVAFFVVLVFYKEPAVAPNTPAKPKRTPGRILLDMVLVLKNRRFALFLLVISGFFFLYNQVYNVMPLYVKRVVETSPAMDLWSVAVVLYESIAGRHPFAGATVRDVVERIRRGEVPDVRTFSPACPEPVAAFLATALSRDRLARPADAGVLRAHLDHLTATIEP